MPNDDALECVRAKSQTCNCSNLRCQANEKSRSALSRTTTILKVLFLVPNVYALSREQAKLELRAARMFISVDDDLGRPDR